MTQLAQTGSLRTNPEGIGRAITIVGSALERVPDGPEKSAAEDALNALRDAHEHASGPLDTLVNTLNTALNELPPSGGRRRNKKTRRGKKVKGTRRH
jgi:hypothetical protein